MRLMLQAGLALTLLYLSTPAQAQVTGDLATLQGSWKTTTGRDPEISLMLSVKDDVATLTFSQPGGESTTLVGKLKIDQNANPKTIDWVDFKRPDGTDAPANLGIYKIDANKLIVLNGGPDNPRPTEFPAIELGAANSFTFERSQ